MKLNEDSFAPADDETEGGGTAAVAPGGSMRLPAVRGDGRGVGQSFFSEREKQ